MYRTINHLAYVIRVNRREYYQFIFVSYGETCRKPKDLFSLSFFILDIVMKERGRTLGNWNTF
jgi:hypothetical protein